MRGIQNNFNNLPLSQAATEQSAALSKNQRVDRARAANTENVREGEPTEKPFSELAPLFSQNDQEQPQNRSSDPKKQNHHNSRPQAETATNPGKKTHIDIRV